MGCCAGLHSTVNAVITTKKSCLLMSSALPCQVQHGLISTGCYVLQL